MATPLYEQGLYYIGTGKSQIKEYNNIIIEAFTTAYSKASGQEFLYCTLLLLF